MTFIIITMTISTVICAFLAIHMLLGEASKSWPSAKGELEHFTFVKLLESPKFPSVQDDVKPRGYFSVRYCYEVNGKKFKGRRIIFGLSERYYRQEEADEFESKLINNDFTIQYLSALPSISVLQSGITNKKIYYLTIGLIVAIGTALSIFYVVCSKILKT